MNEIFTHTFKSNGNTSSLNIFAKEVKLLRYFQKQEFQNPLFPPFNELWQMALRVRGILIEIPPQDIVIKVSGEPYVFYYFFRMLSWLPQRHSFSIESNFWNRTSENFLIQKMNEYVESLEGNFRQLTSIPFTTDYITCKACTAEKSTATNWNRKFHNIGIDVVIPTKNVPYSQVEECIVSVLPQLEENDLIYLVNDNQIDSEICERIKNKFTSVILVEGSHKGIGATRNIGAKIGSNPLIAFVDSDDYILPGYLELQRKFHIEYLDVAATGTWIQSFGAFTLIYPQWDGISPISLLSCLPPAGVLMWKREAISSLSYFNENFNDGFEDFDLVSRAVANQFKIFVVDLPLYMYRRGHTSLTQSWTKSREKELQIEVERNLQFLCSHEFKKYLELSKIHGNNLLLSHPDLVFGFSSKLNIWPPRHFINKGWINLIQAARNIVWLRYLWNQLSPEFRVRIINFLIK